MFNQTLNLFSKNRWRDKSLMKIHEFSRSYQFSRILLHPPNKISPQRLDPDSSFKKTFVTFMQVI